MHCLLIVLIKVVCFVQQCINISTLNIGYVVFASKHYSIFIETNHYIVGGKITNSYPI